MSIKVYQLLLLLFSAKIEVVKCPKDPREWRQVFEIYPVGINEKVLVDLEMMCQCDCEKPGHRVSCSIFSRHSSASGPSFGARVFFSNNYVTGHQPTSNLRSNLARACRISGGFWLFGRKWLALFWAL